LKLLHNAKTKDEEEIIFKKLNILINKKLI